MTAALCLAAVSLTATALGPEPPRNLAPTKWTVVGPFANEPLSVPTPEGVSRSGFEKDYVGEDKPTLSLEGKTVEVVAGDLLDFSTLFVQDTDNKVAYALGTIDSESEATLHAIFGSDDAAKVFVNGKLVHRMWTPGRAVDPESDRFSFPVQKGPNTVLVKVENATGGWGFHLSVFDEAGMKARVWRRLARDLGDREIVQTGGPGYLLIGPAFPTLAWKDSPLIDPLVSPEPFSVRWFDSEANEVKSAEKPGAYAAYVEAKTADGKTIRRFLQFCRVDPEMIDPLWVMRMTGQGLDLPTRKPSGIPMEDAEWRSNRDAVAQFVSGAFSQNLLDTQQGAALLAYLQDPNKPKTLRPMDLGNYSMEYLLKVRRKVQALGPVAFRTPVKAASPSPVLKSGTLEEAGMKPDTLKRLRPLLQAWSKEEGKPFSVVMSRNGVVFLHEGFGVKRDEFFYPASIGKTFFGILFAQFVDQGLVSPDEPVGKWLPDWPTSGEKAVTFRNCLTHTSGTNGHNTYGGFWNPTLDNAFSLWLPDLQPGMRFAYGGDGNNLAGKALELISGKPMAKLMRECLFDPLGADSIVEPDLGFASQATALDVAKIGQLLVNKGSYGSWRLFSPETFQKFLPTKLSPYMPNLGDKNLEWGYANQYMPDPDGPREKGELGPNVIGHGSASSSIFRVDLDTGLVVVMGRYGIGNTEKYNEYRAKVMRTLKECVAR